MFKTAALLAHTVSYLTAQRWMSSLTAPEPFMDIYSKKYFTIILIFLKCSFTPNKHLIVVGRHVGVTNQNLPWSALQDL